MYLKKVQEEDNNKQPEQQSKEHQVLLHVSHSGLGLEMGERQQEGGLMGWE